MIRILQMPSTLSKTDGRMSVVMNIYRNIDRSVFQFDFVATECTGESYAAEIASLGGRVFLQRRDQMGILEIRKRIFTILQQTHYEFMQYHAISKWGVTLDLAKRFKTKVIVHSHATRLSEKAYKVLRNRLFSLNIFLYGDKYVAVSPEAGKKLFLNKKFEYIPNAIDTSKYSFSSSSRQEVRKNLGIGKEEILLGHVGRFSKQKNHKFLVKTFKELHKINENYRLILIGEGELKTKITKLVEKLGLQNYIYFVGFKANVSEFYSAMDVLLLPSFYEGMPTVAVEAQANGLPVIVSNEISKSLSKRGISYLPIHNGIQPWVSKILEVSKNQNNLVREKIHFQDDNFKIQFIIQKWVTLYTES